MHRLSIFALALSLACLVFSHSGQATGSSQQGLTISPAFQKIDIQTDEAQTPVRFTLANHQHQVLSLKLSSTDFGQLEDTGGLFFIGSKPSALQQRYSLSKWLTLPTSNLSLSPGQTISVVAYINNDPGLAAGGHYGAINIGLDIGSSPRANSSPAVNIKPIASTLLFVTKPQGATHQLRLNNVTFNKSLARLPSNVSLRFYNPGNTHVVPRGEAMVIDPRGKVISKGIINENSGLVLPQTYRKYSVSMQPILASNRIGKYKLRVDFRIDGTDTYRSYQTSFWHVGYIALMLISAIIIVTILAMFWLKFRGLKRPKKVSDK